VSVNQQTAASLLSFFSTPALTRNLGQSFTVVLTVSNLGQAAASGVTVPYITSLWNDRFVIPSESLVLNGVTLGQPPVSPISIPATQPGRSRSPIPPRGQIRDRGILELCLRRGCQHRRKPGFEDASLHEHAFQRHPPAEAGLLTGVFQVSPLSINIGQRVTVVLSVTNTGETTATGVQPNPPTYILGRSGSGSVNSISGPAPVPPQSIAGLSTRNFTWVYEGAGLGNVIFSAAVIGTDSNHAWSHPDGDPHLPRSGCA